MQNTIFHGSPVDIEDLELKPLGWSRHIKQKGVYLTDSETGALGYALNEGNVNSDAAQTFAVYNADKQDWETIIVVKSKTTALGYIYEVNRPTEMPTYYYDAQSEREISEYKPGAISIWALAHSVPILHKHVVDYNYMKQNPLHIVVRVLKAKKDFKEAIDKIHDLESAVNYGPQKDRADSVEKFRRTLDEYTER